MIVDSPLEWEAVLSAGIRTPAIVPDPAAAKEHERRRKIGVAAFATALKSLAAVWGPTGER